MKTTPEQDTLLSLQEFNRSKFDRLIPIYEVGVDRAQIAYWRREGLLPFVEKGKWAKVSFVEAIWILLLDSLRSFGVITSTMQALTDYFINRAYDDHVPRKNLEERKGELERQKLKSGLVENDAKLLAYISSLLQDELLLHSFKYDINYFSNLVTYSIATSTEAAILIFSDGLIVEQSLSGHRTLPGREVDFSAPHIKISLNYYLQEFIQKEELSHFLLLARLFNEDEERVLREMKSKNIHEITIKLSDGKVVRIESTKAGQITGEQAEQIRNILALKNYQSVTIDTRDEKTLSFKLTNKRKT